MVLSGQIDLDICKKLTLSFFGGQMMYTRLRGQIWLQVAMYIYISSAVF